MTSWGGGAEGLGEHSRQPYKPFTRAYPYMAVLENMNDKFTNANLLQKLTPRLLSLVHTRQPPLFSTPLSSLPYPLLGSGPEGDDVL